MANEHLNALPFPIKNQAYRQHFAIFTVSSGELLTGGLTTLTGTIFKDGGSTGESVTTTEIGTTGMGFVDLTAAQMNYSSVLLRVTAANSNSTDFVIELKPLDLSEPAGRADAPTLKRFESYLIGIFGRLLNYQTKDHGSGAVTVFKADSATPMLAGIDVETDTTSAAGKLS